MIILFWGMESWEKRGTHHEGEKGGTVKHGGGKRVKWGSRKPS